MERDAGKEDGRDDENKSKKTVSTSRMVSGEQRGALSALLLGVTWTKHASFKAICGLFWVRSAPCFRYGPRRIRPQSVSKAERQTPSTDCCSAL